MQLQPGQNFTIVRQLGMPGDVATYYVQAVVKNSSTGTVLQTVNLTDQGSQRFTGAYQIPNDTSGQGFNIDITTTVYTDSGYSTVSNIYTIDNAAYLVFDRLLSRNVAVGVGVDVDYKRIEKMIEKAIAERKMVVIPKNKETDLSGVISSIETLRGSIVTVVEGAVTPLNGKIQAIGEVVKREAKSVSDLINSKPEFTETDLTTIEDKLDDIKFEMANDKVNDKKEENISKVIENSKKEILTRIDEKMEDASDVIGMLTGAMDMAMATKEKRKDRVVETKENAVEPVESPVDYQQIAGKILKS